MNKKVLILGITGQDGSYLAEILLEKGYEVHGLIRRSSTGNTQNIHDIRDSLHLHRGDLADPLSIYGTINRVRPGAIYNEADQDNVGWSYDTAGYSYDITGAAVGRTLEAVRQIDTSIRFFQPVSATIFGRHPPRQMEDTPFDPQSPYACAKVMAYYLARYYRQTHNMFVSTAILFNHDSPRRVGNYLLQQISQSAIRVSECEQGKIALGNLNLQVDIGYAREYMEAAYAMMQLDQPDDFVIASGHSFSIRELAICALLFADVHPNGRITRDPEFNRPGQEPTLLGDYSKAEGIFGFAPKTDACDLLKMIMAPYLITKECTTCE